MAVLFTTIKNTNQETVIRFNSTANESGTITIANLTAATQARNVTAPAVNIVKVLATGELGSHVRIQRNSLTLISLAPENAPILDFNTDGFVENTSNTFDIVINNNSAKDVSGYLVLRKVAGWDTKVENEVYGAYDDVTRVGASTSLSGSPDKV